MVSQPTTPYEHHLLLLHKQLEAGLRALGLPPFIRREILTYRNQLAVLLSTYQREVLAAYTDQTSSVLAQPETPDA